MALNAKKPIVRSVLGLIAFNTVFIRPDPPGPTSCGPETKDRNNFCGIPLTPFCASPCAKRGFHIWQGGIINCALRQAEFMLV